MAAPLDERSRALRRQVAKALADGGRGHLGASLSVLEILRALYDSVLRYDPARPRWPERDRCILSKGHGCLALYVLLAEKGFFAATELSGFCGHGRMLGGHPGGCKVPGVEIASGSLGHGPSVGLGMALTLRAQGSPAKVFVVVGDGECDEGSVWEAALSAGKHGSDNYAVLVDYNKYQSYGPTSEVQDLEPLQAKWESFGFAATQANGHDVDGLARVLGALPLAPGRPSAIICHTVKGKGVSFAENNLEWHHKSSIDGRQYDRLLKAIG